MPSIETHYLIDFENVHEDGLTGSEHLNSQDHVHLFSTKNAPKISIEKLASFNSTNLYTHKIPVGNQSLDMHLVSYLGYLIGKNTTQICKYIIVGKDTDYDNIIAFWKEHDCPNISRQNQIEIPSQKKSLKSTVVTDSTCVTDKKRRTISQTKVLINTEIQQALSKARYKTTAINKIASIVVKHYGEEQYANNVRNELQNNYSDFSDVYQIVKPIINRYSSSKTTRANATTELNCKIQKILSNAKFTNEIISYVASLVAKNHSKSDGKQIVYQAIIAKYGQKQGLNIYNHIKKHF